MSDRQLSCTAEDTSFSKGQLEAIVTMVNKVVDKGPPKLGEGSDLKSAPPLSGTAEVVVGVRNHLWVPEGEAWQTTDRHKSGAGACVTV